MDLTIPRGGIILGIDKYPARVFERRNICLRNLLPKSMEQDNAAIGIKQLLAVKRNSVNFKID